MAVLFCLLLFSFFISSVFGHGAIVFPPSRNAIDRTLSPWNGPVPKIIPGVDAWCPIAGDNSTLSGENGQACFWFSNGCSIYCEECDGNTRGPIPNEPEFRKKMNVCGTKKNATVCDPAKRTVNTGAKCGAEDDWYYYSPWRAPGSAPVFDSCGVAGGRSQPGHYGAIYTNTKFAKQGDYASKTLPKMPSQATWKTGDTVEVSWTIQANHGGGYQYRLCPADQPLTEECFQKNPLDFVGLQSFRWSEKTQVWFNGTYVSKGTIPEGSTWAMNPIPRNDTAQTGQSFEPRCEEVPDCGSTKIQSKCFCSGLWGPYDLEIVDVVRIPQHLTPGDYVLQWRWDCEESTQVWTGCSDVTITTS